MPRWLSAPERLKAGYTVDADSGCWNWNGKLTAKGYGRMWVSGVIMRVHRYAYILHHGDIPDDLNVCHRCDNRRCVKPRAFICRHAAGKLGRHDGQRSL